MDDLKREERVVGREWRHEGKEEGRMKEQRAALHPCMIWCGNYFHHTANYHFTSDFIYVYSTIFFSTSSCLCQPSSTFFCLVLSLESDFFFKLLIVYRNSSTSNYQRHVKKKLTCSGIVKVSFCVWYFCVLFNTVLLDCSSARSLLAKCIV